MTIEELSEKLSLWRKNKKSKRDRIPEEYWDEAVKLAKESSSSTVAAQLNLSAGDLKKIKLNPENFMPWNFEANLLLS